MFSNLGSKPAEVGKNTLPAPSSNSKNFFGDSSKPLFGGQSKLEVKDSKPEFGFG
jgi:hypothetical protein